MAITSCSSTVKPITLTEEQEAQLNKQVETTDETSENPFADCIGMASKLDSCSEFECSFTHPFDGQEHTRNILGMVDGKCKYLETMPNGGLMECNYAESMRKAVAQQYQLYEDNQDGSFGMDLSIDLGSGETEATYTIDGVEVEDPLTVAMSDGTCIITGY